MKENKYNVPILLLGFNRPEMAQRVFDEIRKIKPRQFFMSVDGPRDTKPGEDKLCEATRDIIKQVDWDCEVKTLFHEKNLGCRLAPQKAISWFFENVEEGIILEDDCVPNQTFFKFSKELLERYRNDERIMVISGNNFQFGQKRGEASYYFSIYPHIWGWATWKRAWKKYDLDMKTYKLFKQNKTINNILVNRETRKYWTEIFDRASVGSINTWDYQWIYSVWENGGLSITPSVNLVTNIGFDNQATHTKKIVDKMANIKTEDLDFPLTHPDTVGPNIEADKLTFVTLFKRGDGFLSKIGRIFRQI